MEHVIDYRDTGKVIFRVLGICALALFLVSNPILLRHRFWTAEVVTRSVALEFTLLVIGIGLLALRKWSAVLASLLAVYLQLE